MPLKIVSYTPSSCSHGVLTVDIDGQQFSMPLVKDEVQELAAEVAKISPFTPKQTLLFLWIAFRMVKGATFNSLIGVELN